MPNALPDGTCGVVVNPEASKEFQIVCARPLDHRDHDIEPCVYREELKSKQRGSSIDPNVLWCSNHHNFGEQR